MNAFWNACWHEQTGPADETGKAICLECGAVTVTTLTRGLMEDFFDTLYRDCGGGFRHSKRCVRLPDQEWVCADDCKTRRVSS